MRTATTSTKTIEFSGEFPLDDELISETYSELCLTSNMELFVKIVNGFQSLPVFVKSSILDV